MKEITNIKFAWMPEADYGDIVIGQMFFNVDGVPETLAHRMNGMACTKAAERKAVMRMMKERFVIEARKIQRGDTNEGR